MIWRSGWAEKGEEIMDIEMYYEEYGNPENKPMIFLHGCRGDHTFYHNQIDSLKDRYHIYALDLRGHGKTPRGTAPFTLDTLVEDLHDFMVEQGIDQATLCGFADGANVVLLFALKYTGMVRAMILNSANYNPRGMKKRHYVAYCIRFLYEAVRAIFSKKARFIMRTIHVTLHEPHLDPLRLRYFKMPILVIAGTCDTIREQHTRRMSAHMPTAVIRVIPGFHRVAKRNIELFNRILDNFMTQLVENPDGNKNRYLFY